MIVTQNGETNKLIKDQHVQTVDQTLKDGVSDGFYNECLETSGSTFSIRSDIEAITQLIEKATDCMCNEVE